MTDEASIWRNRDVALLVTGNTVNEVGDWLLELRFRSTSSSRPSRGRRRPRSTSCGW